MTVILPIIFSTGEKANVLLFVDDIFYLQQSEDGCIIVLRNETEFNCTLTLNQIQKKIEGASMKMFKFN
jgi:hypothetical protein